MLFHRFQLRQADGGRDVRHPVVVADHRKPIAAIRIHALPLEYPDFVSQVLPPRGDHATLACGDDLVAEETECSYLSDGADPPPPMGRAMRFRRIFNDRNAV